MEADRLDSRALWTFVIICLGRGTSIFIPILKVPDWLKSIDLSSGWNVPQNTSFWTIDYISGSLHIRRISKGGKMFLHSRSKELHMPFAICKMSHSALASDQRVGLRIPGSLSQFKLIFSIK